LHAFLRRVRRAVGSMS